MANFMDLPDETISVILTALFKKPLSMGFWPIPNLAITNRRLYAIVLPHYWRRVKLTVEGYELERMHATLQRTPYFGTLIHELNISLDKNDSAIWKSEKAALPAEIQGIVLLTASLRALSIVLTHCWVFSDWKFTLPWTLDLSCCTYLERLHLDKFLLTPAILNILLSYQSIKSLSIRDSFDEDAWSTDSPYQKSSLTVLHIIPREGVSTRILKRVLPCVSCIVKLSITLGSEMLLGRVIQKALENLATQTRLQYLCLGTPHLPDNKHHDLDFTTLSTLDELIVDSVILWPYIDGFEYRNDFYRRLPSNLKRLIIYFPYYISVLAVDFDHDGIVQRNCPSMPTPGTEHIYSNQYIPSERFIWIENLIRMVVNHDGFDRVHLPMLRYIRLSEEKAFPESRISWWGPLLTLDLPEGLENKLKSHGITTHFHARSYLGSVVDGVSAMTCVYRVPK